MEVTVQVRPEAAAALHGRAAPAGAAGEVLEAVKELGVQLRPAHPGADDPLLASFFIVPVPDAATARKVSARLQRCPAVESAYLKPPEAPA